MYFRRIHEAKLIFEKKNKLVRSLFCYQENFKQKHSAEINAPGLKKTRGVSCQIPIKLIITERPIWKNEQFDFQ